MKKPDSRTEEFFKRAGDDLDRSMHLVCEICGKEAILTPRQAFLQGWDYPPILGEYGVISQRTCGECTMAGTAYLALRQGKKFSELSEKQRRAAGRILLEPEILFGKAPDIKILCFKKKKEN